MKRIIAPLLLLIAAGVMAQTGFQTDLYTCTNKSSFAYDHGTSTLALDLHMPNHTTKTLKYENVTIAQEDVNNDKVLDDVYYLKTVSGDEGIQKIGVTKSSNHEELGYWLMYFDHKGDWKGVDIYLKQ